MSQKINVLWIKTQENQLLLKPGKDSILRKHFSSEGIVVSYDNQAQYPWTTTITVARELQSAFGGDYVLNASLLNLSAVPRDLFSENNWQSKYLSKPIKEIPYGSSSIQVRRIGKDIFEIEDLEQIISKQDLIIIPSSFETNINEQIRLNDILKNINVSKPIFNTGSGVEGHEEALLASGADVVFHGTISDKADEVLLSFLNQDYERLAGLPGVFSNVANKNIRNIGARNFRQEPSQRKKEIRFWKERLSRYQKFVDVNVAMVGRSDLKILGIPDLIAPYNAFQDLDAAIVKSILGREVFFAADAVFPQIDCPRECDFCINSGKGSAIRSTNYSINLMNYYLSLGVRDIIPTTDQVLLSALNTNSAKGLLKVLNHARENNINFFYGDGLEPWALHQIIKKSRSAHSETKLYVNLLDSLLETSADYFYLPYENIWGLKEGEKSSLRKLRGGLTSFVETLDFLNESARKRKKNYEVGTNIILNLDAKKSEVIEYYKTMDSITASYSHLNFRYNTFFMIPSNCAPHIIHLNKNYKLYSSDFPELKVVSIPQILHPGEDVTDLENRFLWNYKALHNSRSDRKLTTGTYR